MPPLVVDSLESLKQFVGREIGVTDWLTITQDRITQFAEATEDRQWIHTDPDRARKESPYGATIAHGFLTLSLLSYFNKQAIEVRGGVRMGVNYGLNRVRFPAAVRAGTRIRAHVRLESLKEIRDAIEAVYSIKVEAEGSEKPCCVAEWLVLYYP
ncbi:MAG TPA: MaoC family dehydratase [Candidatus Sulfotelmatobacter sp.]|nr:MaoC family dehydratase [Candidatus Sulfotelmatobacter sp.]